MAKLTPKQGRFVEEYLVDLNATGAALRAGYKHPDIGRRVVTVSHVAAAIAEAKAARAERTEIKADDVVRELAKLGFSNMLDFVSITEDGLASVDLSTLTRDQAAAIHEITSETVSANEEGGRVAIRTKLKLADKRAALESLGRHLGIFEKDNAQGRPLIVLTKQEIAL